MSFSALDVYEAGLHIQKEDPEALLGCADCHMFLARKTDDKNHWKEAQHACGTALTFSTSLGDFQSRCDPKSEMLRLLRASGRFAEVAKWHVAAKSPAVTRLVYSVYSQKCWWASSTKAMASMEPSSDEDLYVENIDFLDDEDAESCGPEINTGGLAWADIALDIARGILKQTPDLEMYSLRAMPSTKRIDIRLDKLSDMYGSPTMDEIAAFSVAFHEGLESVLGEESAGDIEVEISSPGAERRLRIPKDLERFAELPMKVEYTQPNGSRQTQVLSFQECVGESCATTVWSLADVRANRPGKGRPLSRKQREQTFEIPSSSLTRVNLFVDV